MKLIFFQNTMNKFSLAVDCQWSDWTYGECSELCGVGTKNKTRTVLEVERNGGYCIGNSSELEECNNNVACGKLLVQCSFVRMV